MKRYYMEFINMKKSNNIPIQEGCQSDLKGQYEMETNDELLVFFDEQIEKYKNLELN